MTSRTDGGTGESNSQTREQGDLECWPWQRFARLSNCCSKVGCRNARSPRWWASAGPRSRYRRGAPPGLRSSATGPGQRARAAGSRRALRRVWRQSVFSLPLVQGAPRRTAIARPLAAAPPRARVDNEEAAVGCPRCQPRARFRERTAALLAARCDGRHIRLQVAKQIANFLRRQYLQQPLRHQRLVGGIDLFDFVARSWSSGSWRRRA